MKPQDWIQQVHKGCGGEIIIIAYKQVAKFACKKCQLVWVGDIEIRRTKEWQDFDKKSRPKEAVGRRA